MNKRGQMLVTFIIIVPVLLILLGVAIELSYVSYNKKRVNSITKCIILNCIDSTEKNDIIELYDKNNIEYDTLDIDYNDGITINLTSKLDSLLGNIIGKKEYLLKISIHGYKDGQKLKYEKG